MKGEDEMRPKSSKAPWRAMLAPAHGGAVTLTSHPELLPTGAREREYVHNHLDLTDLG